MCHPAAIPVAVGAAQFAMGSAQASMQYDQQKQAVDRRNRAKLKNHEQRVKKWQNDHLLDKAQWKNDLLNYDKEHNDLYVNMIDQWSESDRQLDEIFRKGDHKIEKAIIEMYENDYAGTGSGVTAMRLAGQNARKAGQEKSKIVDDMLFKKGVIMDRKGATQRDTARKQLDAYDKIRFPPVQKHAPKGPLDLEARPSKTGMYLQQASSAISAGQSIYGAIAPSIGDSSSIDSSKTSFGDRSN